MSVCAAISIASAGRLSGRLGGLLRIGMVFVYDADVGDVRDEDGEDGEVKLEARVWRAWWVGRLANSSIIGTGKHKFNRNQKYKPSNRLMVDGVMFN